MVVEALKAQSESEVGYMRKIAALKNDNRSLRRICGVPLMEDSEDEGEGGVETLEGRAQVQASARQSPEQARVDNEVAVTDGPERRVLIS